MEEGNARIMELFGLSDNDSLLNDEEANDSNGETNSDLNVEEGPVPGTIFHTVDSLFYNYQEYARLKGFCVTKKSASKGDDDQYKYYTISCDRGRKSNCKKSSKRINCPAKVSAIWKDGVWMVSKRNDNHNHELDPAMSRLMAGHRNLTTDMKRQLDANDIAGLKPCKNIRLLEVHSGGPEKLSCLSKDCRNYIDNRRRLRLGDGDAEAIRNLFLSMQQKDRDFFHLIETDYEGRLTNVLWIHSRCKAAYAEFHDVVSFDTTYLVNRYRMPFATIVGINHHGQSILLGCALISHEDIVSFKWVFSTWISAMGGVHPNAILTDQCESIRNAIREVMPNTVHRFCLWHILCKVPEKFRRVEDFCKASNEFKSMIYSSLTREIFETKWIEFVQKHNLENNLWLVKLYSERHSWVPVYLNHMFWAGMVSTQRSEGMHAYFDGYVHSRSSLKQFVEQYEIAMSDRNEKEFLAEFKSKNKVMNCISDYAWERQFQCSYTNSMFKLIQEEIKRLMYCDQNVEGFEVEENGVEKHKIREKYMNQNNFFTEFEYTVEFKEDGQHFSCSCKKFECKGVLCCHILKLVSLNNIRDINDRYILSRWRKDVHRPHTKIFFRGGYPHMTEEYKKFREVEYVFQECTDIAMGSVVKIELVKQRLESLKNELLNLNDEVTQATTNDEQASRDNVNINNASIRDPVTANTRGRPRQNRYRGRNESRGRGGRRSRGGR